MLATPSRNNSPKDRMTAFWRRATEFARKKAPAGESDESQTRPKTGVLRSARWTVAALLLIGSAAFALGFHPQHLFERASPLFHATPALQANLLPAERAPRLQSGATNEVIDKDVAIILAETEEIWSDVLREQKGIAYTPPKLVLYAGLVQAACGKIIAPMGPIYCPLDDKIYLDTDFFAYLRGRVIGGGDFAYAYILAHEIGHRVQDQIGILGKARIAQGSAFGLLGNAISVRIELMADCFAGIWANRAQAKYHFIDQADVAKMVATARSIGDDRLQQAALGRIISSETFTHGTSAQRADWFTTGLKSGNINACNTFAR
jgi:uncharacterized protein